MMPGMLGGMGTGMAVKPPYDPAQDLMKKSINQLSELLGNDLAQAYQKGMPPQALIKTLFQMLPGQQGQNGQQPAARGPQQQPPQPPGAPPQDEQLQDPSGQTNVPQGALQQPAAPPVNHQPLVEEALGQQIMQQPTPVAPTTQQYTAPGMQPASGPFGQAAILPDGGARQAGVFGSLFAPSATTLLANQGQAIQNVQGVQEIRGHKPLQAGDREKIELENKGKLEAATATEGAKLTTKDVERRDKFYENLDKPVSSESSRSLTFAKDIVDSSEQILKIAMENPSALKSINIPGNPFGQKLRVTISRMEQALLRYSSGATITKEEKKEIREIIPKIGLKSWLQDPTTAQFELNNLKSRFKETSDLLDPQSPLRNEIKSLEKAGYKRTEIWEYMKHKGRV